MTCKEISELLPLFVYGELSFDEEDAIEQHLPNCSECRAEFDRLKVMHAAFDREQANPDMALLVGCRRKLMSSVDAVREHQAAHDHGLAGFLRSLLPTNIHFGLPAQGLSAVAFLAAGFFFARMLPPDTRGGLASVGGSNYQRVRDIEPDASGRIQIVVEQVHQQTLSGGMNDEQIRRLLIAATRESIDPGVRVVSMNLLKNDCSQMEVRRALLHSIQHDPDPSVRLKAIEGLRSSATNPDVRKTIARVLLEDQNSGVRTEAIDVLTSTHDPEIVGTLQALMEKEDNNYIRLRCEKTLREMRASMGSF